jgi:hypothetical protein
LIFLPAWLVLKENLKTSLASTLTTTGGVDSPRMGGVALKQGLATDNIRLVSRRKTLSGPFHLFSSVNYLQGIPSARIIIV